MVEEGALDICLERLRNTTKSWDNSHFTRILNGCPQMKAVIMKHMFSVCNVITDELILYFMDKKAC